MDSKSKTVHKNTHFWKYLHISTVDRFDADCVMKNIYETFDSANTGNLDFDNIFEVFSIKIKFHSTANGNFLF